MSMPKIPAECHRPDACEVIIDLLKSIAMEETALSHIVNAEAEHLQALVKKLDGSHLCPDTMVLVCGQLTAMCKLLDTVLMKEWILYKKLEDVMSLNLPYQCPCPCPHDGPPMKPEDMMKMMEEVKDAAANEKNPMIPKDT